MPAGFDDHAVLDHQDAIRVHDRRKPMRDDESGAALAQFRQRLLDVPFGFRIERCGRFVEQDDR